MLKSSRVKIVLHLNIQSLGQVPGASAESFATAADDNEEALERVLAHGYSTTPARSSQSSIQSSFDSEHGTGLIAEQDAVTEPTFTPPQYIGLLNQYRILQFKSSSENFANAFISPSFTSIYPPIVDDAQGSPVKDEVVWKSYLDFEHTYQGYLDRLPSIKNRTLDNDQDYGGDDANIPTRVCNSVMFDFHKGVKVWLVPIFFSALEGILCSENYEFYTTESLLDQMQIEYCTALWTDHLRPALEGVQVLLNVPRFEFACLQQHDFTGYLSMEGLKGKELEDPIISLIRLYIDKLVFIGEFSSPPLVEANKGLDILISGRGRLNLAYMHRLQRSRPICR